MADLSSSPTQRIHQWGHSCTVLRADVDPAREWGDTPAEIVPIFGWGPIPD